MATFNFVEATFKAQPRCMLHFNYFILASLLALPKVGLHIVFYSFFRIVLALFSICVYIFVYIMSFVVVFCLFNL